MKKLLQNVTVGITTIAMMGLFSFAAATPAQAQTSSQLQQQIQNLLQQISQLKAQIDGQQQTNIKGCETQFSTDLSVGSRGSEVLQVQRFLNTLPSTQVANAGPGSPGNETMYFGPLTRSAVVKFQNSYRAQILTPLGLSQGTGYWGPSSRSQANAICAQRRAQQDDDDDDGNGDGGTDPDDDDDLRGGEGSIDNYRVLGAPGNMEISEGDTEDVMAFEFEAGGSDLRVERIDFLFEADSQTNGDEPWDYIEELSLYRDGDRIARQDASDKDDWSEEGDDSSRGVSDEYKFRFSNLSEVVRESDEPEFTLEITVRDNIDSADIPQDFLMSVGSGSNSDQGIRATDAEGLNQYGGDVSDTQTVTFAGADDGRLKVSESKNNPDERTVQVSGTNDTNDVELLVFDLDPDNQDILVEDLDVDVTAGGDDVVDIVKQLHLYRGNNKVRSESIPSGSGSSKTVTFDNVDIELDDKTEFTVRANLRDTNNQSRYQDGDTISVSVDSANITAEETTGAEDNLDSGDLSGVANGNTAHLYETASQFRLQSTSAERGSTDSQGDVHKGTYRIRFAVTADDDKDIYLPFYNTNNSVSIVASSTDGTGTVLSPEPSMSTIITRHANSDSNVTRKNNTWKIPSGSTGVFTLTSNVDNEGGSSDRFIAVEINSVKWNTSDSTSGLTEYTFGLSSWETDPVFLEN